jgi:hypothetical protein
MNDKILSFLLMVKYCMEKQCDGGVKFTTIVFGVGVVGRVYVKFWCFSVL